MRIGIDTYSYHRLLGALRPGERAVGERISDGGPCAIRLSIELGADAVSLQTCFLGPAGDLDVGVLREAAAGRELIIAWGAPDGLAYGQASGALDDALAWLRHASALGSEVMRIVLGGPSLWSRDDPRLRRRRVLPGLRALADRAADCGIRVAIENHGDATARDLLTTLDQAARPTLGVCFDTANAVRVGDDPVAAAVLLRDHVDMVHLKDIEPMDRVTDHIAGPRSVAYGEGIVPIAEVLEALRDPIDRGAPVCIELGQLGDVSERELVVSCVRWLRTAGRESAQRSVP